MRAQRGDKSWHVRACAPLASSLRGRPGPLSFTNGFGGLVPRFPPTRDRAPRSARGRRRGFHQSTSKSMAAIPSSGSLVATHNYYRRRLGSTSSNSSCGSAECPAEAIPHHPGLPKADPGHWWASFFFGKSTLPFMATVLESPEHSKSPQDSSSVITCDLEATRKPPGSQPSKVNIGPPS